MQKPIYLILFLFLIAPALVSAQASEEASVTEVINRLFKAMNKADSTILNSTFAKEATLASIGKNKEGNPIVKKESVQSFAIAISKQPAGSLSEEIWNLKIQIDGNFAQAWCDYAFYFNNQFSHCGVDAFQLYKSTEGWKIFQLADTRRKDNCIIPEEIQKKHQ